MDIERVNDFTLKFFVTYKDIEVRGFDREEIWYNRERGEELFWEIMDEAHYKESFSLEGPLWIQVQALEKGLEIIVTRAQLSDDGSKLELPISNDKHLDIPLNDGFENMLDNQMNNQFTDEDDEDDELEDDEPDLTFIFKFKEFEDVISLSHTLTEVDHLVSTILYNYDSQYYLQIKFFDDLSDGEQDDLLSRVLEYGFESGISSHMLEEYGKVIIPQKIFAEINKYFN